MAAPVATAPIPIPMEYTGFMRSVKYSTHKGFQAWEPDFDLPTLPEPLGRPLTLGSRGPETPP